MIVYLTPAEAEAADLRAYAMHTADLEAGASHRYGARPDGGAMLRRGVRCETAASKWSGEPMPPPELARRHEPDVGYFDVRGTDMAAGSLLVHKPDEGDPADRPYLLVIEHERGTYRVVGWAYGHEAQQARYWRDDERMRWPCYLVPQYDLRPPELLPIARPAP